MNNEENTLAFEFIAGKIESAQPVQVYLVNGVKLEGVILKQDREAFTLTMNGKSNREQLVQKLAVSTLS